MTLIGAIGDSHWEEGPRFPECERIHHWIADDMQQRGVDVVVHTGDLFDKSSTRRERLAVADWIKQVADFAPVLLIRGNHDPLSEISIFSRLRTRHPVVVEEGAGVHVLNGVAVAALAWPQKANVLATLQRVAPGATKAEGDDAATAALRAVLAGLGDQLSAWEGPRLFAAHAQFRNSRTSLGQPLMGHDFELGLEDLVGIPADFFVMGHIHLPQEWDLGGGRQAAYTGSTYRTAYGETEEKGYILAEYSASTFEGWKRVPTPCRRMLLLEAAFEGEDFSATSVPREAVGEGDEVRFRYTFQADRREQAAARAAEIADTMRAAGATVKVEGLAVAVNRARAPEIATAATLADKLDAFERVRGVEFDEPRRTRVRARADQLQEEVRSAA